MKPFNGSDRTRRSSYFFWRRVWPIHIEYPKNFLHSTSQKTVSVLKYALRTKNKHQWLPQDIFRESHHWEHNGKVVESLSAEKKKKQELTCEKAHARTMCLCSKECNSFPVNAFHIFLKRVIITKQTVLIPGTLPVPIKLAQPFLSQNIIFLIKVQALSKQRIHQWIQE